MITIIDLMITLLSRLRRYIIEHRERKEFVRLHYREIENAEEFWDKYH